MSLNLQGQLQGQAELQAQLQAQAELQKQHQGQHQGQGQGQHQGQGQGQHQGQHAYQGVDTEVWNSSANWNGNGNLNGNGNANANGNGNHNGNANYNANGNKNYNDNHNDNYNNNYNANYNKNYNHNEVKNDIENNVKNDVEVNVSVDLDLSSLPDDQDVIDIEAIQGIEDSIVMPDAVSQTTGSDGNNFNIDQVNNLADNDYLSSPSVNFGAVGLNADLDVLAFKLPSESAGVNFSMEGIATGGTSTIGTTTNQIGDDGNLTGGVSGSADAVINQEAFTQSIVMGANVQFNSVEMTTVGGDLSDAL